MRREGVKRMVTGGLFFFVLAPLVFVGALVLGVGSLISGIDDAQVPPGGTVELQAGEEASLFVLGVGETQLDVPNSDTGAPSVAPRCTVLDPEGSEVDLTRSSGNTEVSEGGQTWESAYTFTPRTTGAYQVTCGNDDALVLESGLAGMLSKGVGLIFLAIGLPFLIGVVGLGLFIWGLVKFNSSKNQPAPGYPAPQGYYPPQGYDQPPGNQPPYT